VEEARRRFARGIELAEDGNFDAALVEMRRAYELAPSYRLLYNIGRVHQQLKDYARALDAYEEYLAKGGSEIPADRAADTNQRIGRLTERVGFLQIHSTEPDTEVSIDDRVIGKTPLEKPIRVNTGQRRVSALVPGRPRETRVVELAAGETKPVEFNLKLVETVLPPPPPPPKPINVVPYVSWGVTAALAGAATAAGIVALNKASAYDALEGQFGVDPQKLLDARNSAHSVGIATDILVGTAILAAGVSVYFTLRPPPWGRSRASNTRHCGVCMLF
jgi:tetratricopeptide (TPR) repeat protein